MFKTNSGFLSYIGITPPLQDRGFGTKLYKMITDILNRDAIEARREPLRSFIYELESPAEKCSLEEKIQRKRRFRFYRRLGAKRIKNISYALPKLRESNNKKTTHLILMVYSTISISKDFLKNLVDDYLRIAYGFKKGLVRGNNEKTFRRVKKQIFQAIEERYTPN